MKALTVRQPWASLIAAGVKTIETRSWSTRYRGPLAIHAGMWRSVRQVDEGEEFLLSHGREDVMFSPAFCGGAVVATCTLADVVPIVRDIHTAQDLDLDAWVQSSPPNPQTGLADLHLHSVTKAVPGRRITDQLPFGDFTPGRHAWLLTDITPCDPVPAKGRLGLWEWDQ